MLWFMCTSGCAYIVKRYLVSFKNVVLASHTLTFKTFAALNKLDEVYSAVLISGVTGSMRHIATL